MSAIVPSTARKTVAWYCPGLGVGRSAGLQGLHTELPGGTGSPHRTQRSIRRFTRPSLWHGAGLRVPQMAGIA